MSESTGRKMGPRETSLLDQARSFVRAGHDENTKGEPPWFYYAKASELSKGLQAAMLADALEEALDGWSKWQVGAEEPEEKAERQRIKGLRALLAEVDRG